MEKVKLSIGIPVERDDGRYYVPVYRTEPKMGVEISPVVLRVASDAFLDLHEANEFAKLVVEKFNAI